MDSEIDKRKKYILIFLFFTMALALYYIHEFAIQLTFGLSNSQDLINRDIETTSKKWLNGYLGNFFRYKHFGIMNWMIIPLAILWLMKKRERWNIALAFVCLMTLLMIGVKGYTNWRYQLTVFPFITSLILLLSWDLTFKNNAKANNRYLKIFFFSCFGILIFLSYFHQKDFYKNSVENLFRGNPYGLPMKMIDYISSPSDLSEGSVLVCDQPWFYYYTSRKGVDYIDPKISNFYESKDKKGALDILDSSGIKFILISRPYDRLFGGNYKDKRILEIIRGDTVPIFEDRAIQLLLIAKDRDQLYNDLYEPVFSKKSLVRNGSFENWQANQHLLPDFWQIYGGGSVQKEGSDKKVGKYALKITGDNFNFYQNVTLPGLAPEKKISCFALIKTSVSNKYRIQIYDGIDSSFSERHTGDGSWKILRAIHNINPKAASLEIRAVQAEKTGGLNDVVYVDGILLFQGEYYSPNALIMEQDHLLHSVIEESTSR